jgi:phosphoglycolate phosphatase
VLNGVADEFGFRRIATDEVPSLRRMAPRELMRALGVPVWKVPRIARHMHRMKREAVAEIPLFPGAEIMLRTLSGKGIRLALVTSDIEANARAQLGPAAALFTHYACGASLLGKAAKFKRVLREAKIAPGQTIAIGDEIRDIDAARAAAIACGAVAWGYADPEALAAAKPDLMFASIDDIVTQLAA